MRADSSRTRLSREARTWTACVFVFATGVRMGFAVAFPTIHGGDAAARLANAGTLVLGYQLPLPQAFVVLGKAVMDDPMLVRLIFCAWGGALASGVAALLAVAVSPTAAILGGVLLSLDPLLIHYSIVPYQESVAYSLLAWAFYFATTSRANLGAVLMAAACLSRYEAWLFLPAFVWFTRARGAALIACIPIVGWTLWWQGLAPAGLYVLDLDQQSNRWSRVAFLAGKFLEYETLLVPALAGAAFALALVRRSTSTLRFAGFLLAAITVVVTFGHEFPPGSGLMSERLIHLPVLLSLSLAAITLERIRRPSRPAGAISVAVVLLLGARNVRFETALLRAAAQEPDLALARDIAWAVDSSRRPGECVSVEAPPVNGALLDAYVAKVGASFGDVSQARERAAGLAATSPDRDRIAAHLRAPTGTVRSALGCPLVVRVDGVDDSTMSSMSLVTKVSAGSRRAQIFRKRQ